MWSLMTDVCREMGVRTNIPFKDLTDKEKDIIQSHMWPLTPADIPHSREAALVCIADKMSSSYETVLERRAQRKKNRR